MAPFNKENTPKSRDYVYFTEMDHEVRTPMSIIFEDLELILKEPVNDKVRGIVNDIQVAASGLMTVVSDVIDYDLLKCGSVPLFEEEYTIQSLMGELEEQGNRIISEKNISFETRVSDKLNYRMYGDYGKIKKILDKLLSNAAAFTEEGRISVDIDCESVTTDFMTLVIKISDTSGQGISDEMCALYDDEGDRPMNLEKPAMRRLYMARMYAELVGGSLLVSSSDEGAVNTVRVPQRRIGVSTLEDVEGEEEIKLSDKISFWISNARVLIVDDNQINAYLARYIMKSYGVDSDIVDNGMSAVELVKRVDYDIIFMDYIMPGLNGTDIAEIIRGLRDESDDSRTDYFRKVPLVIWTAETNEKVRESIVAHGVNECISKPLDLAKLERVLGKLLPFEKFRDVSEIHENYNELDGLERIGIKAKTALRSFSNKEKEYKDVLISFCKSGETKRNLIRRYLKQKDYQNYMLSMHGLVGAARVVGAKWLADKAKELEDAVRDGHRETLESDTAVFLDYMEKLLVSAEKVIRKEDEELIVNGLVDETDLRLLIDELIECFETYQIEQAEELFYNVAQCLYSREEVMEHIHSAEVYIMDYDYNKVMEELLVIKQML